MAKAAGGKTGKYGKIVIRPSNIKLDQDFFSGRNQTTMEDAMRAKFSRMTSLENSYKQRNLPNYSILAEEHLQLSLMT